MSKASKKNWFKASDDIDRLIQDLSTYPVKVNVDPVTKRSFGRIKAIKPLKDKDIFIGKNHIARTNRITFKKKDNGYFWEKLF